MILQISLVFIATFIAGYFVGSAFNKRKKIKNNNSEKDKNATTLTAVEERQKKELLN